jgi:hypothetical protein
MNSQNPEAMSSEHYNAIVVGAGAGGGVVAKQLAFNGLKVLLLERGGWPDYDAHINDELISQRTWVLGTAFGPDGNKSPRVFVAPDGSRRVVVPTEGYDYNHIAECVGSGTVSYGAMAWRFMPEDFRMRSTYGAVEGSTLDDWPVSYDDLEPCYEKAEWEIGVAGDDYQNPFAPPRKKAHPMPPFEYNREGRVLADAAKRLGLHPFPLPMLRNSVPYGGRPACIRNRTCCGYACPVDGKNGTQNTVIPAALATGNCTLRTNCKVTEVLMDKSGRATWRAHVRRTRPRRGNCCRPGRGGRLGHRDRPPPVEFEVPLFPNGAGNNHDWVGATCRAMPIPALSDCSTTTSSITSAREPASPSAISTTTTPASSAAACWPTSSTACPTSSATSARRGPNAGARPTRTSSGRISCACRR